MHPDDALILKYLRDPAAGEKPLSKKAALELMRSIPRSGRAELFNRARLFYAGLGEVLKAAADLDFSQSPKSDATAKAGAGKKQKASTDQPAGPQVEAKEQKRAVTVAEPRASKQQKPKSDALDLREGTGIKSPRGRPLSGDDRKKLISVYLPSRQIEALRGLAQETGEPSSFHIREAIRQYLDKVVQGKGR